MKIHLVYYTVRANWYNILGSAVFYTEWYIIQNAKQYIIPNASVYYTIWYIILAVWWYNIRIWRCGILYHVI